MSRGDVVINFLPITRPGVQSPYDLQGRSVDEAEISLEEQIATASENKDKIRLTACLIALHTWRSMGRTRLAVILSRESADDQPVTDERLFESLREEVGSRDVLNYAVTPGLYEIFHRRNAWLLQERERLSRTTLEDAVRSLMQEFPTIISSQFLALRVLQLLAQGSEQYRSAAGVALQHALVRSFAYIADLLFSDQELRQLFITNIDAKTNLVCIDSQLVLQVNNVKLRKAGESVVSGWDSLYGFVASFQINIDVVDGDLVPSMRAVKITVDSDALPAAASGRLLELCNRSKNFGIHVTTNNFGQMLEQHLVSQERPVEKYKEDHCSEYTLDSSPKPLPDEQLGEYEHLLTQQRAALVENDGGNYQCLLDGGQLSTIKNLEGTTLNEKLDTFLQTLPASFQDANIKRNVKLWMMRSLLDTTSNSVIARVHAINSQYVPMNKVRNTPPEFTLYYNASDQKLHLHVSTVPLKLCDTNNVEHVFLNFTISSHCSLSCENGELLTEQQARVVVDRVNAENAEHVAHVRDALITEPATLLQNISDVGQRDQTRRELYLDDPHNCARFQMHGNTSLLVEQARAASSQLVAELTKYLKNKKLPSWRDFRQRDPTKRGISHERRERAELLLSMATLCQDQFSKGELTEADAQAYMAAFYAFDDQHAEDHYRFYHRTNRLGDILAEALPRQYKAQFTSQAAKSYKFTAQTSLRIAAALEGKTYKHAAKYKEITMSHVQRGREIMTKAITELWKCKDEAQLNTIHDALMKLLDDSSVDEAQKNSFFNGKFENYREAVGDLEALRRYLITTPLLEKSQFYALEETLSELRTKLAMNVVLAEEDKVIIDQAVKGFSQSYDAVVQFTQLLDNKTSSLEARYLNFLKLLGLRQDAEFNLLEIKKMGAVLITDDIFKQLCYQFQKADIDPQILADLNKLFPSNCDIEGGLHGYIIKKRDDIAQSRNLTKTPGQTALPVSVEDTESKKRVAWQSLIKVNSFNTTDSLVSVQHTETVMDLIRVKKSTADVLLKADEPTKLGDNLGNAQIERALRKFMRETFLDPRIKTSIQQDREYDNVWKRKRRAFVRVNQEVLNRYFNDVITKEGITEANVRDYITAFNSKRDTARFPLTTKLLVLYCEEAGAVQFMKTRKLPIISAFETEKLRLAGDFTTSACSQQRAEEAAVIDFYFTNALNAGEITEKSIKAIFKPGAKREDFNIVMQNLASYCGTEDQALNFLTEGTLPFRENFDIRSLSAEMKRMETKSNLKRPQQVASAAGVSSSHADEGEGADEDEAATHMIDDPNTELLFSYIFCVINQALQDSFFKGRRILLQIRFLIPGQEVAGLVTIDLAYPELNARQLAIECAKSGLTATDLLKQVLSFFGEWLSGASDNQAQGGLLLKCYPILKAFFSADNEEQKSEFQNVIFDFAAKQQEMIVAGLNEVIAKHPKTAEDLVLFYCRGGVGTLGLNWPDRRAVNSADNCLNIPPEAQPCEYDALQRKLESLLPRIEKLTNPSPKAINKLCLKITDNLVKIMRMDLQFGPINKQAFISNYEALLVFYFKNVKFGLKPDCKIEDYKYIRDIKKDAFQEYLQDFQSAPLPVKLLVWLYGEENALSFYSTGELHFGNAELPAQDSLTGNGSGKRAPSASPRASASAKEPATSAAIPTASTTAAPAMPTSTPAVAAAARTLARPLTQEEQAEELYIAQVLRDDPEASLLRDCMLSVYKYSGWFSQHNLAIKFSRKIDSGGEIKISLTDERIARRMHVSAVYFNQNGVRAINLLEQVLDFFGAQLRTIEAAKRTELFTHYTTLLQAFIDVIPEERRLEFQKIIFAFAEHQKGGIDACLDKMRTQGDPRAVRQLTAFYHRAEESAGAAAKPESPVSEDEVIGDAQRRPPPSPPTPPRQRSISPPVGGSAVGGSAMFAPLKAENRQQGAQSPELTA